MSLDVDRAAASCSWPPTPEDLQLLQETNPEMFDLAVRVLEQQKALRDSDRREPLPDSPGALAVRLLGARHVQRAHHNLIDEQFMRGETEQGKRVIINIGPRYGKALALDTPLATPNGWTTMGEIRVGDQVFDDQGAPCTVTYVSPIWLGRDCYEVTTLDGGRIVADAEHEWPVRQREGRPTRLRTTAQIAAGPASKAARIATCRGLELPTAVLPLDPYLLGVWLGDGDSRAAAITSTDPEIIDRIRERTSLPVIRRPSPGAPRYSLYDDLNGRSSNRAGTVRTALISLGVWGNKHIPTAYLRADRQQRLDLLNGLVDTDGYVNPTSGQVEFCSAAEQLAQDVHELVWSLGAKATLVKGRATLNGVDIGPKYRVMFLMADAAWLPRKRDRCRDSTVADRRYVHARPCASVPVQCIQVDSASHLYLAGRSMLPTHNTNQLRWGCLHRLAKHPDRRVIYASYAAELAEDSSRWVRDQLEANDLGPRPRRDSRAVDRWWMEGHTGGMLAAGIGGGITGFGADDLVIDDVIKDHEQAYSSTWRKKVWTWYTQTAYDRLEPGANVWIVMTRWHPDDLTGRLLKEQPGVWTVIRVPTIALPGDPLGRKPGELLWPERYDAPTVEAQRTTLGPFGFGARHQQDPKLNSGGVFDEDLLRETRVTPDAVPLLTMRCVALDPSASDEGRDEAGITVQGVAADGQAYLIEDLSGRLDPETWGRRALLACLRHDCDLVYESNLTPVFIRRTLKTAWEQLQRDWLLLRRHRDGEPVDQDELSRAAADGLDGLLDRPGLGLMPAMKPVRAMVGKQLRAEPVAQVFRQRRAHLAGTFPLLEDQMVNWRPGDDSPDRLDAMVHGVTWLVDRSAHGGGQAVSPVSRQLPRVGPMAATVGGRARVR